MFLGMRFCRAGEIATCGMSLKFSSMGQKQVESMPQDSEDRLFLHEAVSNDFGISVTKLLLLLLLFIAFI